ncbi:hypothetical protein [Flavisolibacter nicotianae]|uniref:hypothetical protein n=1 Tax=Flavisolibacter nicotianae TaxID=2364882 RepID=UPI000EB462B5|nr:hypothetical protein [Flavisolibacter nicotianae]
MKSLLAVFSFLFLNASDDSLLIVDRDLKHPPAQSTEFTLQHYLRRTFPVYAADVQNLTDAVDEAVKLVDRKPASSVLDTIAAGHTTILLATEIDGANTINITLVTELDESHASYSFALVRNEADVRKAQRRLLDFATYLNQ